MDAATDDEEGRHRMRAAGLDAATDDEKAAAAGCGRRAAFSFSYWPLERRPFPAGLRGRGASSAAFRRRDP